MLLLAFLSIRGFPRLTAALIIPALVFGMAFVGEFERVREFIRGPYVMPGYMYANQILMTELPTLDSQGLLSQSYWFNVTGTQPDPTQEGAYLFGQNCSVCHTVGGINNIVDRVKGRSEDVVAVRATGGRLVWACAEGLKLVKREKIRERKAPRVMENKIRTSGIM